MDKQKTTQQGWYDNKTPLKEDEIVNMSTHTHIKRLKELFPVRKAKLSLNCGCGRGGQEDIFGPSIGIDISFENIRSLIQRGGQGIVADMEFLPFKNNAFDIVYGFGILHHLNDIPKGVLEATRVLKKGGHIGFGGENNGWCPLVYIMSFVYRNWRIEKGSYRIRKRRLKKIFHESGVRDFVMRRHGMTIYGLGSVVYKLTSFMDKFLSRFSTLNTFSGYCYVAGRKV
jgi:ubiquinone/menaquinone biosynthesis C-methylase UbiE